MLVALSTDYARFLLNRRTVREADDAGAFLWRRTCPPTVHPRKNAQDYLRQFFVAFFDAFSLRVAVNSILHLVD
jgi:hypothetical protein